MTGTLYVVATPIGNLGDLSPRAVDVLRAVAVVAAEDTRRTGRLLQTVGIRADLVSCHDHNEDQRARELVARLVAGDSVALVSDAGTPLVSDPGYRLVRQALAAGIDVVPVPGPCALVAALSASGLATDSFTFVGFLPRRGTRATLESLAAEPRTLVFYEAPARVSALVGAMIETFGANRQAVIARELTKLHEQIRRGTLAEMAALLADGTVPALGEFVVLVAGGTPVTADVDALKLARHLVPLMSVKQVAEIVADVVGMPRRAAYDLAVEIKNSNA